jgi:hypothetical protein
MNSYCNKVKTYAIYQLYINPKCNSFKYTFYALTLMLSVHTTTYKNVSQCVINMCQTVKQ